MRLSDQGVAETLNARSQTSLCQKLVFGNRAGLSPISSCNLALDVAADPPARKVLFLDWTNEGPHEILRMLEEREEV